MKKKQNLLLVGGAGLSLLLAGVSVVLSGQCAGSDADAWILSIHAYHQNGARKPGLLSDCFRLWGHLDPHRRPPLTFGARYLLNRFGPRED